MKQISLNSKISNREDLTEKEINLISDLIGYRCHQRTKRMIRRKISCVPDIPNYGIYARVIIDKNGVHYIAWQSYPDEIRTLRELVLDR